MPKPPRPATDGPASPAGEIILYQTEDGRTRVECRFVDETIWLSQALIAEVFQVTVATVNEHIKNIIAEGEVQPGPTIRKFRIVRREGAREVGREIEHSYLDATNECRHQGLQEEDAEGQWTLLEASGLRK